VITLDANSYLPDCAFVEDAAVVLDEIAIITRMGVESRREESAVIEAALKPYREIARIEAPATLEGGDVLRVGKTLLIGQSSRTNEAGIRQLQAIAERFGYRVQPIPVRQCLHLKTACCALPDGRLVVNTNWIELPNARELNSQSQAKLPPIEVPSEEPWGANFLSLNSKVIIDSAYPGTAELIRQQGFEVLAIDLSEFAKAEAGVTCLSLLFA
jgi:dimethylargininase